MVHGANATPAAGQIRGGSRWRRSHEAAWAAGLALTPEVIGVHARALAVAA
jgi:hypothetical protein